MTEQILGKDAAPENLQDRTTTRLLVRFGVGAFFAMNVMILSIAVSSQYGWTEVHSMKNVLGPLDWGMLLLSLPVLVLQGVPVLRHALQDLFARRITINLLFVIGVGASVVASALSYQRGYGPIYLETTTMLLVLYTFGRWLDARAKSRTHYVLTRLLEIPLVSYRRLEPTEGEVFPDAIAVGDLLRILPGDMFPVDGTVENGASFVDESNLTGESRPVVKQEADPVFAGTLNRDGVLAIRVTAVQQERRLARIQQLLQEALARPTRSIRRADRVTGLLVPVVLVLALATCAGWWVFVDFSTGLMNGLAVLLISCPCALGLATPLVVWAGLETAARGGILVRSGDTLEDLARAEAFLFDKTGTLSSPEQRHGEVFPREGGTYSESDLLRLSASLETSTRHPLAEYILLMARERGIDLHPVSDVHVMPARGISGIVQCGSLVSMKDSGPVVYGGDCIVHVGNADLLLLHDFTADDSLRRQVHRAESEGRTVIYVVVNRIVEGVIALQERYEERIDAMIAYLKHSGRHVEVITGDEDAPAAVLEKRLGVLVRAKMAPEDKVRTVRYLKEEYGCVVMFGDGLNDAAAIAEADVGLCMAQGAQLSNEVADVTFVNRDLLGVIRLTRLAMLCDRKIRQNLWWAYGYNAVGLALAMAGLLHPIVSAVAMTVSSLFVSWNSLQVRDQDEPAEPMGVPTTAPEARDDVRDDIRSDSK